MFNHISLISGLLFAASLTSCGAIQRTKDQESVVKNSPTPKLPGSTSDSTPLESIGRGAKVILSKDIEIPANMFMGVLSIQTTYIRSTTVLAEYRANSIQCGVTAKEKSLDRRVIPAGTVLELSGQWWRDPNGDINGKYLRENLGVAKPGEIASVTCLVYERLCDSQSGMCSAYYQPKMTILDLKNGFLDVGAVEQASPVIIK